MRVEFRIRAQDKVAVQAEDLAFRDGQRTVGSVEGLSGKQGRAVRQQDRPRIRDIGGKGIAAGRGRTGDDAQVDQSRPIRRGNRSGGGQGRVVVCQSNCMPRGVCSVAGQHDIARADLTGIDFQHAVA